jgi:probable rRNA maturation factor
MPDARQLAQRAGVPVIRLRARRIHAAQGRQLAGAVRGFLVALGRREAELSLTLLGDASMRRLNREARGIDRSTDVLSFPAARVPGSPLLGDLVIAVPVARRWAKRLRRPVAAELALYAAHGLLHLVGHDHQTAKQSAAMEAMERKLLGERGLIGRNG